MSNYFATPFQVRYIRDQLYHTASVNSRQGNLENTMVAGFPYVFNNM